MTGPKTKNDTRTYSDRQNSIKSENMNYGNVSLISFQNQFLHFFAPGSKSKVLISSVTI